MTRILILSGLCGLSAACNPNVGRELFACTTSDDCTQGRECKGGFCRGRGTDGTCLATTCAVEQASCGQLSDGCGQVLDCGSCQAIPGGLSECVMGSCRASCPLGSRVCSGACVLESKDSCGPSCSMCPRPTGGDAACTSGRCELTCPAGTRYCAGANACLAENVTACGVGCSVCEQPPGQDGGAICNGIGSADGGFCDFVADAPEFARQPDAGFIPEGELLTLRADATASGTISYQWIRNGTALVGQTQPVLRATTVVDGGVGGSGEYWVEATNTVNFAGRSRTTQKASNHVTVDVVEKPRLLVVPQETALAAGTNGSLVVVAVASGDLTYQWKKNLVPLAATSSTLTLPSFSAADEGQYSVLVSNAKGVGPDRAVSSVESTPVVVHLHSAPQFLVIPDAGTVVAGSTVVLQTLAAGSGVLTYAWTKNGQPLSSGPQLTLPNLQKAAEGRYQASVTSVYLGSTLSATSPETQLVVNEPPVIVSQPQSLTRAAGSSASVEVIAASDAGVLRYQWNRNGVAVAGATTPSLSLTPLTPAQNGQYSVVVSNELNGTFASVTSSSAQVTAGFTAPQLTAPAFVVLGDAGTATVAPQGEGTFYSWSISNGVITGVADAGQVAFRGTTTAPVQLWVSLSDSAGARVDGGVSLSTISPGTWFAAGRSLADRSGHTATVLTDGRILLVGGLVGGVSTATAEIYDPVTEASVAVQSMTTARSFHSATLLVDGRVLVAGGQNQLDVPVSSSELFNPATGGWSIGGDVSTARSHHTASRLADGRVIIAGGSVPGASSAVSIYSPLNNVWAPANNLSTARHSFSAVTLVSGDVLAMSGYNSSAPGARTPTCERFQPGSGQWVSAGSIQDGRNDFGAARLLDGGVLLCGGYPNSSGVTTTCETYTGGSNWSAASPMNVARGGFVLAVSPSGTVVAVGGFATGNSSLAQTELRTNAAWTAGPPMALPRGYLEAVFVDGGMLVVTGGTPTGQLIEKLVVP